MEHLRLDWNRCITVHVLIIGRWINQDKGKFRMDGFQSNKSLNI